MSTCSGDYFSCLHMVIWHQIFRSNANWSIDGILISTTTPGQSRPMYNYYNQIFHTPQISTTRASPSKTPLSGWREVVLLLAEDTVSVFWALRTRQLTIVPLWSFSDTWNFFRNFRLNFFLEYFYSTAHFGRYLMLVKSPSKSESLHYQSLELNSQLQNDQCFYQHDLNNLVRVTSQCKPVYDKNNSTS